MVQASVRGSAREMAFKNLSMPNLVHVVDESQARVKACRVASMSQASAVADAIQKLALNYGVAKECTVHSRYCAVHPVNRSGTGVDPMDVHALLSEIVADGFSYIALGNPQATEKAAGEAGKEQEKFNLNLYDRSDGFLPYQLPEDMRIMVFDATHTTNVIRVADVGCKGFEEALLDDCNNISRERVIAACPTMQDPIEKGLTYTVYCKEFAKAAPEVIELLRARRECPALH